MKKAELVVGKVYLVKHGWRGNENLVCVGIPEDTKNRTALFAPVDDNAQPSKFTYTISLPQIQQEVADNCKEYLLDKKIKDAKAVLNRARREKIDAEFKQVRKILKIDNTYSTLTPKNWDTPSRDLGVHLSLDEWEVLVSVLKKAVN